MHAQKPSSCIYETLNLESRYLARDQNQPKVVCLWAAEKLPRQSSAKLSHIWTGIHSDPSSHSAYRTLFLPVTRLRNRAGAVIHDCTQYLCLRQSRFRALNSRTRHSGRLSESKLRGSGVTPKVTFSREESNTIYSVSKFLAGRPRTSIGWDLTIRGITAI